MALLSSEYEAFRKLGFVKLPGAIPPPLLHSLRELFDTEMAKMDHSAGSLVEANGKIYVNTLERLCNRENMAALEMLGQPFLLEIAEQICGPDFFMIQEFAVIKQSGDELPVLWHQDMLHEGNGHCFTIGFYLDDVQENDGALRVVPESHTSGRSICELKEEPCIEVPMNAGDILIHDMMLAHSSEPMRQNRIRRVLYFEFVSRSHVLKESIYTDELVKNRTRLIHVARELYNRRNKLDQHPFEWRNELAGSFEPVQNLEQLVREIYSMPINARPSAYCFDFA